MERALAGLDLASFFLRSRHQIMAAARASLSLSQPTDQRPIPYFTLLQHVPHSRPCPSSHYTRTKKGVCAAAAAIVAAIAVGVVAAVVVAVAAAVVAVAVVITVVVVTAVVAVAVVITVVVVAAVAAVAAVVAVAAAAAVPLLSPQKNGSVLFGQVYLNSRRSWGGRAD